MRRGTAEAVLAAAAMGILGACCSHPVSESSPPSCIIGGTSVAARAHNPENLNQCCLPSLNATGWSDWFQDGGQVVLGDGGEGWWWIGDLNGDGRKDLVYSGMDDGDGDPGHSGPEVGVLVQVNQGGGSYAPPLSYPFAASTPSGLYGYPTDLNGDGYDDLILSSLGCCAVVPDVQVLMNQRDGTFGAPIPLSDTSTLWNLIAADANGDGVPDLFTVGYADAGPQLRIGLGDGRFDPPVLLDTGFPGRTVDFRVGSLRGNGVVDIVTRDSDEPGRSPTPISVRLGDGKGGFSPPVFYGQGLTGAGGYSFGLFDFDGDGLLDVVVSEWPQGGISENGNSKLGVLHGNGDGTLGAAYDVILDPPALEWWVEPADLTGGGHHDLMGTSVYLSDAGLYGVIGVTNIYWRLQDGGLSPPVALGPPDPNASDFVVSDLDGDGTNDILVVSGILNPSVGQIYLNACGAPTK